MCIFCENVRVRGDGNAGVGSGRGVVAVSAYMGGTRGSGVLCSAGAGARDECGERCRWSV